MAATVRAEMSFGAAAPATRRSDDHIGGSAEGFDGPGNQPSKNGHARQNAVTGGACLRPRPLRDRRAGPPHSRQHRFGAAGRSRHVRLYRRASWYGMTADQSGDLCEDLAASMLASTLGIEFDPGAAWNERKKLYEQYPVDHRKPVDHSGGPR